MTIFVDIGALDDIPRQGARVIRTAQGCVAVFRTLDDRVFALDDRCPHKGGPLSVLYSSFEKSAPQCLSDFG